MFLKVFLLFCVLGICYSVDIPSYLVPCSRSHPECLPKSAQDTLKAILHGDKKFKIPSVVPLVLPLVDIVGTNLNLTLTNLNVIGLENVLFDSLKIDTDKKFGEAHLSLQQMIFVSDYKLKGKILVLELNGADKCNITAEGLTVTWTFNYDLIDKNGEKYAKILKDDTKFTVKKAYFQFDKLFKDQDQLTTSTNEVLNKEWESVVQDLGAGISTTVGNVLKSVTSAFFERIPFDKLYTP